MLGMFSDLVAQSESLRLAASSIGTALIAACASLLGVLVGGLTTGYIARQAERRRGQLASDAAWRLLQIEVGNARDAVHEIRGTGHWPIGWNRTWSAAWRDTRDKLLRSPPANEDALRRVATACARIDQLEGAVNTRRSQRERRLTAEDQIFLWRMQQLLDPACKALECQPGEKPPNAPAAEELAAWENEARTAEGQEASTDESEPRV
jgi:hypothetical protein